MKNIQIDELVPVLKSTIISNLRDAIAEDKSDRYGAGVTAGIGIAYKTILGAIIGYNEADEFVKAEKKALKAQLKSFEAKFSASELSELERDEAESRIR